MGGFPAGYKAFALWDLAVSPVETAAPLEHLSLIDSKCPVGFFVEQQSERQTDALHWQTWLLAGFALSS